MSAERKPSTRDSVNGLIILAARELANCEHPVATVNGRIRATCGRCGAVMIQGVGWSPPLLLHKLQSLIKAADDHALDAPQERTSKRSYSPPSLTKLEDSHPMVQKLKR